MSVTTDTPTATRPLSVSEVFALATIVGAATTGSRVRFLAEDGSTVVEGTARSVERAYGGFLRREDDVRDAVLRVTTLTGVDVYPAVARLVDAVAAGALAVDSAPAAPTAP